MQNEVVERAESAQAPRVEPSFNDDDVYVFDVETCTVIASYGASSATAQAARRHGVPVKAGQSWVKGRTARSLGLLQ
ncbi:hypothetical protein [Diaphorobacter caeni]|uniref:hypothetical protein n=1 Tax=Diaphorobacter caeni TaxID=2784387 RepID=UPI00188EA196|nr:hypothetical protein [Diaphorobacter caeni]MBF5006882.1 hypothetical protein [Diaphorobacter caeni]